MKILLFHKTLQILGISVTDVKPVAKVIWQRPHQTPFHLAVGDGDSHVIQRSLDPQETPPKQFSDPFSCFCTAYPCVTNRQKNVAIINNNSLPLMHLMQPKKLLAEAVN